MKNKTPHTAPLFGNTATQTSSNPFEGSARDFNDYGLLSLDIATKTGWCTKTTSGVWDFTPKRGESSGIRLIRLRAKLIEICQLEKIKLIVAESIPVYSKFPNIVGLEMMGVLKLFCYENNIQITTYTPTEIKKFSTGKGNADKQMMLEAAKKYKSDVTSFDESDAILIYQFAINDLSL